jgi:hypothetical protein
MVTPIPTSPDGDMEIDIPATNSITGFTMTVTVPPLPTDKTGLMYIWPGLQTGGAGPATLLQPLLIYGPGGCNNQATPAEVNYQTWSVQGYNVNPNGSCGGGNQMAVNPGDTLTMNITQTSSATTGSWLQTITDVTTGQSVTWSITSAGVQFLRAMITVEVDNGNTGLTTSAPISFADITLTLANAQSGNWCNPAQLGMTDSMTVGVISADTKSCSISRVTLMSGPTSL